MRDRLLETLGDLSHERFLVYVMGPYKAIDPEPLLDATAGSDAVDLDHIPANVDFGTLVGSEMDLEQHEAVRDLLLFVRDRLRTDPGVNAFLALDIDIPLEDVDAGTQSIEFALASNAIVYIVPNIGDNLGVGIETGAVLEAMYRGRDSQEGSVEGTHQERVLFVHESGVRSAMIASLRERWDARVYSYADREDLIRQVRLFVRDTARKEQLGDLPTLE